MKVGQAVAPSHNSARAATGSSPGQSRQLQSLGLLNVFLFKNVFVITHKQNIKQAMSLAQHMQTHSRYAIRVRVSQSKSGIFRETRTGRTCFGVT